MLKNSKVAACQGQRVLGCIIYSILSKYLIEPVPIWYYTVLIQNVPRNISQKMKLRLQRTGSKRESCFMLLELKKVARKVKSCSKSKKLLKSCRAKSGHAYFRKLKRLALSEMFFVCRVEILSRQQ